MTRHPFAPLHKLPLKHHNFAASFLTWMVQVMETLEETEWGGVPLIAA